MTHGTMNAYKRLGCRCDSCTEANRDRRREERNHQRNSRRWYNDLTREQRCHCQVCGTPLKRSMNWFLGGQTSTLPLAHCETFTKVDGTGSKSDSGTGGIGEPSRSPTCPDRMHTVIFDVPGIPRPQGSKRC